jgi:thiamine-monophosphate kinase
MDLGLAAARAFEAALSDIAAMGARPLAALCSWQVASDATTAELARVRRALARSAERSACPIVGGNVTRAAVWRFTTTLLGHVRVPVLRSTARPGHRLWLSGDLGLAACGRAWLAEGAPRWPARGALRDAVRVCVTAFRAPHARVSEGRALDGRCQAAIDVSDGLAAECRRLADASGVRVVIDESRLRAVLRPELTVAADALGLDPLALALYGGEDYALLVSGPSRRRPLGACAIGEVVEGKEARLRRGARLLRLSSGYDHLA